MQRPASSPPPRRARRTNRAVAAVAVVSLLLLAGIVSTLAFDGPDTAPTADLAGTDHVLGGGSDGAGDGNRTAPEPSVDRVSPNATVGGAGPAGPAPAVFSFEGAGDEVTDAFTTEQGLLQVSLTYLGDGYFSATFVNLDDGNASRRPLHASGQGDYEGVRYIGLPAGRYSLDVHGSGGAWEVTVEQPRADDAPGVPRQWTGSGDDLDGDRAFQAGGEVAFHTAHAGVGEFVVRLYDAHGNLVRRGGSEAVVSDHGDHAGSVRVALPAEGTYFVDVQAVGDWSVEVSR